MMTDYDVPFNDIHDMMAPVWYYRPWPYIGVIVVCIIVGVGWCVQYRYRKRQRVRQTQSAENAVRYPSYWADALYDAETCQQQAQIYSDFLTYLKHLAQECYSVTSTAMTDYEFVAWGREQLPSEYAQQVHNVVQHAEYVRFQRKPVDSVTLENDYMFVNQMASYMQSRE